MIKQLDKKPKGLFQKLPDHYMWFELHDESKAYAYVGIEIIDIWAALHLHILQWNHNILRSILQDWIEIKGICKQFGAKQLVASNDDVHDKKWFKFIRLFGFPEPQHVLISKQRIENGN